MPEPDTVISFGQVIRGGVLSVTVTEKAQVAVRLAPSVARQITWVVPTGKVAPLAGPPVRTTTGAGAQLSAAVGVA